MTELRTLKDFEDTFTKVFPNRRKEIYVNKKELKQEAIKWVKAIQRKIELNTASGSYDEWEKLDIPLEFTDAYNDVYGMDFIKHFFNITEEDLK